MPIVVFGREQLTRKRRKRSDLPKSNVVSLFRWRQTSKQGSDQAQSNFACLARRIKRKLQCHRPQPNVGCLVLWRNRDTFRCIWRAPWTRLIVCSKKARPTPLRPLMSLMLHQHSHGPRYQGMTLWKRSLTQKSCHTRSNAAYTLRMQSTSSRWSSHLLSQTVVGVGKWKWQKNNRWDRLTSIGMWPRPRRNFERRSQIGHPRRRCRVVCRLRR
mmetsp:Transcript_32025/g.85784  ORF Transcript_32025/g.85784 Transcript_32025/m.85784 type:complete len:214 (+) Transcript_32025:565-1206(+)